MDRADENDRQMDEMEKLFSMLTFEDRERVIAHTRMILDEKDQYVA